MNDVYRSLSPRKQEIIRLLALGKVRREIAADLGLKVGTVNDHIIDIFAQLGVHNALGALQKCGFILKPLY